MISTAFDLGEEIALRTLPYKLHKVLWDRFDFPNVNLQFENWGKIKYLNETCDNLNDEVNSIPDNTGGLYLFYVKCNIIAGITEYPIYIGRAQFTEHQNLRKRVREYYQLYAKNDERPKITKMFKYWANDLYLAYFVLDNNDNIVELEKQLINNLLFPMNDEIPDQEIKQAIKAF